MSREKIIGLRPEINTFDSDQTTPVEHFQNSVIRPIIKYQHDWLISWVEGLAQWKMISSFSGKKEDFFAKINDYFSKQQDKKGVILGAVCGLMTIDELSFYQQHEKELNKRIIQMVVQRLTDTYFIP